MPALPNLNRRLWRGISIAHFRESLGNLFRRRFGEHSLAQLAIAPQTVNRCKEQDSGNGNYASNQIRDTEGNDQTQGDPIDVDVGLCEGIQAHSTAIPTVEPLKPEKCALRGSERAFETMQAESCISWVRRRHRHSTKKWTQLPGIAVSPIRNRVSILRTGHYFNAFSTKSYSTGVAGSPGRPRSSFSFEWLVSLPPYIVTGTAASRSTAARRSAWAVVSA
jgi:hypothetical protein